MANEELINALRGVVREEVNTAISASEQRMRALVREEVNASVYASEQRTSERLDRIEANQGKTEDSLEKVESRLGKVEDRLGKVEDRLGNVEDRQSHLEGMVLPMADHLKLLRTDLREMRGDQIEMRGELRNVVRVLELVSTRLNDLEQAQTNLEKRVEVSLQATSREKQEMYKMLQYFTKEYNAIIRDTHAEFDQHENTPIDETHPRRRPHSAA